MSKKKRKRKQTIAVIPFEQQMEIFKRYYARKGIKFDPFHSDVKWNDEPKHPIEIAAKHASFDILGWIQERLRKSKRNGKGTTDK